MTREEIINEINCILFELDNGEDAVSYLTRNDLNWLNENIKALRQEPFMNKPCVSSGVCEHDKEVVLDKISAEIEQTYETDIGFLIHDETKRTILNIIDRYRAESEGNK